MSEVRSFGWFGGQCLADYNIGVSIGDDEFGNPIPPSNGSLPSIMAMIWRIKKYRYSISWNGVLKTYPFGEEEITEFSQNTYVDLTRIGVEEEKDYVCNYQYGIGNPSPFDWQSPLSAAYYDVQGFGFTPLWKSGNNIDKSTQIYGSFLWQPIIYSPEVSGFAPRLSFGYPSEYIPSDPPPIIPPSEITINLGGGVSFNTFFAAFGNQYTEDVIDLQFTINSWSLKAIEWWEYDPNDGKGPIYDKTTGQRLRDDV
jgi:hypothetical protein